MDIDHLRHFGPSSSLSNSTFFYKYFTIKMIRHSLIHHTAPTNVNLLVDQLFTVQCDGPVRLSLYNA